MADQVLGNQEKILANQTKIEGNQSKLDQVLGNQKQILANQTRLTALGGLFPRTNASNGQDRSCEIWTEVYMYHSIVKRLSLQNFLRVNRKDYAAILKNCSPDVHHRFGGHHALGGERHNREALGRWFERLGRLAPTLQLTVHDVWVKGFPWNTTVIMRWSAVQDLPDGSPYNNHGVHVIRMRWGKVFDIDANEDSQLVAASLQIWAAYGVNEALADPILS